MVQIVGQPRLGTVAQTVGDVDGPSFVAVYPGYANYIERREGLTPRMFRLHPVG